MNAKTLLVPFVSVLIGCQTIQPPEASSAAKLGPPEPPEASLLIRLSESGFEPRFLDPASAPMVPVREGRRGKPQAVFTLQGETRPEQEFDITYVVDIPTEKMRPWVDSRSADDKTVRSRFADRYESSLGLLELDCDAEPRCAATVDLRGNERKEQDGWLISLDEKPVTPVYLLVRQGGAGDWKTLPAGYLRMDTREKLIEADLRVPLDNTGIGSWVYLNPRKPAPVFESLPANLAAEGSQRPEGQNLVAKVSSLPADQGFVEVQQAAAEARQALPVRSGSTPNRRTDEVQEKAVMAVEAVAGSLGQLRTEERTSAVVASAARAIDAIQALAGRAAPAAQVDRAFAAIQTIANEIAKEPRSAEEIAVASKAIELLSTFPSPERMDAQVQQKIDDTESFTYGALADLKSTRTSPAPGAPPAMRYAGLIQEQALAELGQRLEALKSDTLQARLKQKRIRFDNETADRYFVVTFPLEKCPNPLPPPEQSVISFTEKDGSCTGTVSISPRAYVDIDASVVDLAPRKILQFNVDFFDQTDDPTNSTGFISLTQINPADPKSQPPDKSIFGIVAGLNGKDEPFIRKPTDGDSSLFAGRQKNHFAGSGRLDSSFFYGNRANAKLSLAYKSGDFGGDETTDKIDASQYQINVFGTNGFVLTYGKTKFAAPSNQIAIGEQGQGFRLAWRNLSLAHILKNERASLEGLDQDRDSSIFQWTPISLNLGILRSASLTVVRGEERLEQVRTTDQAGNTVKPEVSPFVYETYGGEVSLTEPLRSRAAGTGKAFTGSLAFYYSKRDSKAKATTLSDGRGYVGLGTLSLPFDWQVDSSSQLKRKPRRVATLLAGYGRGDDPKTPNVDESYIGETGAFSRDVLFVGNIFTNSKSRDIRPGLSNKQYFGLQLTDNTTSVLSWIGTKILQADPRDIISESTTLKLHDYRFNREVLGDRDAGREADLDFVMEAPKGIKWSLSGAYFQPGKALDTLVKDSAWSVSLGVSIDPFN